MATIRYNYNNVLIHQTATCFGHYTVRNDLQCTYGKCYTGLMLQFHYVQQATQWPYTHILCPCVTVYSMRSRIMGINLVLKCYQAKSIDVSYLLLCMHCEVDELIV